MTTTTTHNSESREVRELTERELKDDLVSGGITYTEIEWTHLKSADTGKAGYMVDVIWQG